MFLDSLNKLIEIREKIENKRIIIFGAGAGGKRILFTLLQIFLKPIYLVDNNVEENNLKNYLQYEIYNPKVLLKENKKDIAILIASSYDEEISLQLKKMGFKKNKDFYSTIFDSQKDAEIKKEKEKKAQQEAKIKKKKEKETQKKVQQETKKQEADRKRYKNCTILSSIPPNTILGKGVKICENVTVLNNVKIGAHSYVSKYSHIGNKTKIGKYCSIAMNVAITPSQHPKNYLSSSPELYSDYKDVLVYIAPNEIFLKNMNESKDFGITFTVNTPATIGNDVWIGKSAVIMDGIKIGSGAIIGSNAVVTRDIPPYAIAVGTPAKITGYRFSDEIIKKLLRLKWWDMNRELLKNLPSDIEKCVEYLENIKKTNNN